jgi:2-polyprenyl-3-methyl-5-hydroxy-6-metoxy-1,4-benzoquinol methylase
MMASTYKQKLYTNYITTHNGLLYDKPTLSAIENNFVVWDSYYKSILPTDLNLPILDIGCGNGSFVYYLHQRGYKNAYGVDVSLEQVNEGQRLGIENIRVCDLSTALNEEKSYQCIIARDVVEHFTRQEAFDLLLMVSGRLLKGGLFIMQVPNGQGIFYTSIFFGDYTHEQAYTESSVRQLFLNTGFSSSFCKPTGPMPHGIVSSVRWLLWNYKVLVHRFWKAVETGNGKGIFTSNLIAIGYK